MYIATSGRLFICIRWVRFASIPAGFASNNVSLIFLLDSLKTRVWLVFLLNSFETRDWSQ